MYKIYELFNKCGWPEWLQTENIRLMAAVSTSREQSFIKYRKELIENGLIEFKRGGKGFPCRYKLCLFSERRPAKAAVSGKPGSGRSGKAGPPSKNKTENATDSGLYKDQETENNSFCISESTAESEAEKVTENAAKSAALYKPKETKHILPYGPLTGTLPKRVLDGIEKWIEYKREKRQSCSKSELYELFDNARKNTEKYGEDAVLEAVSRSIANGYKGIQWDRLGRPAYQNIAAVKYGYPQRRYSEEELKHLCVDLSDDAT
jgi:hypothetical protein